MSHTVEGLRQVLDPYSFHGSLVPEMAPISRHRASPGIRLPRRVRVLARQMVLFWTPLREGSWALSVGGGRSGPGGHHLSFRVWVAEESQTTLLP